MKYLVAFSHNKRLILTMTNKHVEYSFGEKKIISIYCTVYGYAPTIRSIHYNEYDYSGQINFMVTIENKTNHSSRKLFVFLSNH